MMEWTKDDLEKVDAKRAKVISLEKRDDKIYNIKFDNGDSGVTRINANSKVYLVEKAEWVEYVHSLNVEVGVSFIDILRGETNV